jgi:hypothetical protein
LGKKFEAVTLNIPEDNLLPEQNEPIPYVLLIGEEAFLLKHSLTQHYLYRQVREELDCVVLGVCITDH